MRSDEELLQVAANKADNVMLDHGTFGGFVSWFMPGRGPVPPETFRAYLIRRMFVQERVKDRFADLCK